MKRHPYEYQSGGGGMSYWALPLAHQIAGRREGRGGGCMTLNVGADAVTAPPAQCYYVLHRKLTLVVLFLGLSFGFHKKRKERFKKFD